MMPTLCLMAVAGLLVIGALIDIDCRRLPNWLTSTVAALYALFVALSPTPVDWLSAFLVAGLVFAAGFACFAAGAMGGGDVKLLAALALWAGVEHIAVLLVVTAIAGGLLSVIAILRRRLTGSPTAIYLQLRAGDLVSKLRPAGPPASVSSSAIAGDDVTDSLPYGVAIAAGGFAVIHALLQL